MSFMNEVRNSLFDISEWMKCTSTGLASKFRNYFMSGHSIYKFSYRGKDYEAKLMHEFVKAVHEYDLSFLLERIENIKDIEAFKLHFIATTTLKSAIFRAGINPRLRVDAVWHMLITYTPDYKRFCLDTWGRMLAHDARMSFDDVTRISVRDARRLAWLVTQITGYDYLSLAHIVGTDAEQEEWRSDQAHAFERSRLNELFHDVLKHD